MRGAIERLMNADGEVEDLRSLVSLPSVARSHIVGILQARRTHQGIFLFQMATVLPLRMAWVADILSQASPRDVKRQRCCKRGSGDGRRRAETGRDCGTMARQSDLPMPFKRHASPLKGEVRSSLDPSARPSAAADSENGKFVSTACLFTDSVGL